MQRGNHCKKIDFIKKLSQDFFQLKNIHVDPSDHIHDQSISAKYPPSQHLLFSTSKLYSASIRPKNNTIIKTYSYGAIFIFNEKKIF